MSGEKKEERREEEREERKKRSRRKRKRRKGKKTKTWRRSSKNNSRNERGTSRVLLWKRVRGKKVWVGGEKNIVGIKSEILIQKIWIR